MACWQKKSRNRVFVYFWDKITMKQRTLPRDETRPLDRLTDEEIYTWIRKWEQQNECGGHSEGHVPLSDPLWISAVETFCQFLLTDFARHPYTIQIHRRNLLVFALPFFRDELGLKDLVEIPDHSRLAPRPKSFSLPL